MGSNYTCKLKFLNSSKLVKKKVKKNYVFIHHILKDAYTIYCLWVFKVHDNIYYTCILDNIIVNHNQVMFNMICIIRHTYWVSTNTIKCNIHVLIRVPRMCISVIGYMYTLHIPPLYNTISNYHNFKSLIKKLWGFFLWYFDELFL